MGVATDLGALLDSGGVEDDSDRDTGKGVVEGELGVDAEEKWLASCADFGEACEAVEDGLGTMRKR